MTIPSNADLVKQFELTSVSQTVPLREYLHDTWKRIDFIKELANARSTQQYSDSFLGRLWQLVTPLLNAAIYFLIFGVLLGTRKGIDNFPAFLVAGVFAFNFMQTTITAAANCIPKNDRLIKAIHFPKLVLPLATAVNQVQQYLISLGVLMIVAISTGEPLTLMWLALPIALILQAGFIAGISLIVARWGARSRDITQLLPFFLRTWRYASGVFFSIAIFTSKFPGWVGKSLKYNPGAVYIDLIRDSLMVSIHTDIKIWIAGVIWALVFLLIGLVYFYRGERTYV
jgi:teichoic acid transport system permease protein